jgi:hypothetical protein
VSRQGESHHLLRRGGDRLVLADALSLPGHYLARCLTHHNLAFLELRCSAGQDRAAQATAQELAPAGSDRAEAAPVRDLGRRGAPGEVASHRRFRNAEWLIAAALALPSSPTCRAIESVSPALTGLYPKLTHANEQATGILVCQRASGVDDEQINRKEAQKWLPS